MNISLQGRSGLFCGSKSMLMNGGLKSTEQKLERQAKRDNQIAFYEKQKENLKNMECDSLEDIAEKLEMFHSYEDQIAAVKASYNNEQMWHTMDEAKELGEKIAKEAQKLKPKTEEERKEELVEEALGTDEEKGVLTEILEEISDIAEEISEESEKLTEELAESVTEEVMEEKEELTEEITEKAEDVLETQKLESEKRQAKRFYDRIDIRI